MSKKGLWVQVVLGHVIENRQIDYDVNAGCISGYEHERLALGF